MHTARICVMRHHRIPLNAARICVMRHHSGYVDAMVCIARYSSCHMKLDLYHRKLLDFLFHMKLDLEQTNAKWDYIQENRHWMLYAAYDDETSFWISDAGRDARKVN